MQLSIANLNKSKAFTSKPVEKQIVWGEHTFTAFIRPLSYHTAIGDITARSGCDPLASRIASSVCDADGKAVFTVADITGEPVLNDKGELVSDPERGALADGLTNALLIAIAEVQNVGKTKVSKK